MNRYAERNRQNERNEIKSMGRERPFPFVVVSLKVLEKLLAGGPFCNKDIEECVEHLTSKFRDSKENLGVTDKEINLNVIIKRDELKSRTPFFIIHGRSKKHWVHICILLDKFKRITNVLYKDPSHFVHHAIREQEEPRNEEVAGPIVTKKLHIAMECMDASLDDGIVKQFADVKSFTKKELNKFNINNAFTIVHKISLNEDFKISLIKFIDHLPFCLGIDIIKYNDAMKEELKFEPLNVGRIKETRNEFIKQEDIEQIIKDYPLHKKFENSKLVGYRLSIQKEFPEECAKFTRIFKIVSDVRSSQDIGALVTYMCDLLEINFDTVMSFYNYEDKLREEEEDEEEKRFTQAYMPLQPIDYDEIIKTLPEMSRASYLPDSKPVTELMKEVALSIDEINSFTPQSSEEIEELEERHMLVKEKYEQWSNKNMNSIIEWAKKKKKFLGIRYDSICEAIAVMDRAYNLLTGGNRLWDTQILATLTFFQGRKNIGKICQIKTGEGKTLTIALIAALRVMQGEIVDVITNNLALATDSVEKTRKLYSIFGITVETNDAIAGDVKTGYLADVLYGPLSNFQYDYLSDAFEGSNIRHGRVFNQVIVDEVDDMLFDKGIQFASNETAYPGLECWKYTFISLWQELQTAEKKFADASKTKIENFLKKYPLNTISKAAVDYAKLIQEIVSTENKTISLTFLSQGRLNLGLVYPHLERPVNLALPLLCESARRAKHDCQEQIQYRIIATDNEQVISPINYHNPGVKRRTTIWSLGLRQFIELKHNLALTCPSLPYNCISNLGYLKKYKIIFAVTSNLGSRSEQEFFSSTYNVDYARLPPRKDKKFEELSGKIVPDHVWQVSLTVAATEQTDNGRGVLVVCENESDLNLIRGNLEIVRGKDFTVKVIDDSGASDKNVTINPGDIVLATNITENSKAFKISQDLEKVGGLHVCVGFLPASLRVEKQIFGSVYCHGSGGTAQLFIKQSEVEEVGIFEEKDLTFTRIKYERDRLEKERLDKIQNELLLETNFNDELFGHFAGLHKKLKKSKKPETYAVVLESLKEYWALWMLSENYTGKKLNDKNPLQEYKVFERKAKEIVGGKIKDNPFYCISLANYYTERKQISKAEEVLNDALLMKGVKDVFLTAGLYLKLFETVIHKNEPVLRKLKKAEIYLGPVSNANIPQQCIGHLNNAKTAIEKEIKYIEKHLMLREGEHNVCLEEILVKDQENSLLKQFFSRLVLLKIYSANIDALISTLKYCIDPIFSGTATLTLENLETIDLRFIKYVTETQLQEFRSLGMDTIYSIKEIGDVSVTDDMKVGCTDTLAGATALEIGFCFPPALPLMDIAARTLISEGVINIVVKLLGVTGNAEFIERLKCNFVTDGIPPITCDIDNNAITESTHIIALAIETCQNLSPFVQKTQYLISLCDKCEDADTGLREQIDKLYQIADFSKHSRLEQLKKLNEYQTEDETMFKLLGGETKLTTLRDLTSTGKLDELTKTEIVVDILLTTIKEVKKGSLTEELVLKPLKKTVVERLLETIKAEMKVRFKRLMNQNEALLKKIVIADMNKIDGIIGEVMDHHKSQATETAANVAKVLQEKLVDSSLIDIMTVTNNFVKDNKDYDSYWNSLITDLENKIKGSTRNSIDDQISDYICEKVCDKAFLLFLDKLDKFLRYGDIQQESETEAPKQPKTSSKRFLVKKNFPIVDGSEGNSYVVLGLSKHASSADIRKRYRRLALQTHPDKHPNDPTAYENMKRINAAFEKIKNKNVK